MTCVLFVMSPRLRKFIGTIALLILVVVWALVAMALAQMPAIRENAVVSVAYYVIAGLGLVPAGHSDRHVDEQKATKLT